MQTLIVVWLCGVMFFWFTTVVGAPISFWCADEITGRYGLEETRCNAFVISLDVSKEITRKQWIILYLWPAILLLIFIFIFCFCFWYLYRHHCNI